MLKSDISVIFVAILAPLEMGPNRGYTFWNVFSREDRMKKIFGRAGFFPLPLRERAGVRGILFSAVLIAGWLTVSGSVAAFGQNNSAPQPSNPQPNFFTVTPVTSTVVAPPLPAQGRNQGGKNSSSHRKNREAFNKLTLAQRRGFENQISQLKGKLAEYHQGKLGDQDGHAILWNILYRYAILGSTTTPEFQMLKKEYDLLRKKHPEFKKNPPIELKEQKTAREAADKKEQDIKEMAKNFVPKDTAIAGIYGREHYLLLVYQYHIEFYALPLSISVKSAPPPHVHFLTLYEGNKNIPPSGFLRNSDVKHVLSQLNINKSVKVMSFKHPLQHVSPFPFKPKKFFWACENLLGKYRGSTSQEDNILRTKYRNGEMAWSNESAEYHDFCGAVSWDGKIIYRLPFRQHDPDTAVFIGPLNSQATSIILTVNEITNSITSSCISKPPFENGYDPCEDAPEPGLPVRLISKPKDYLLYTYPDDLKTFKAGNRSQYIKTLQKHGFNLKNLKRYGI